MKGVRIPIVLPSVPDDEKEKIVGIVQDILSKSKETYHKVQVAIEPESLIVTMSRAKTYTADIMRVRIDSDYNVKSTELIS